jgi:hypothetical protein
MSRVATASTLGHHVSPSSDEFKRKYAEIKAEFTVEIYGKVAEVSA